MNNNNFKTKLLNLLLISAATVLSNYPAEGTQINAAPQVAGGAGVNGKQSIISTCHAIRAVSDHAGKAATWNSDCTVEVWTGDKQPDLSFLDSENRTKVLDQLARQKSIPPTDTNPIGSNNEIFERSKYLADEAATRHYLCMEARRSILDKLKLLLPAGMTDCTRITEVMNSLKLTPELEAFIGQVNGPMKDLIARIHSIEQNSSISENEKREAIRVAKTDLTRLLDATCQDEHPSIRYNNISYLPNPAMERVRMVLVMPNSGRSVHFFSAPESQLGPHAEYLRGMTEAAAQHAQLTGKFGNMEAIYHNLSLPGSIQSESDVPGVISLVSNKAADKVTVGDKAKEDRASLESVKTNTETSEKSTEADRTTTDELKSSIDKFWEYVDFAKDSDPKNFTSNPGFKDALKSLLSESNLRSVLKVRKVDKESTQKFWKRKFEVLNNSEKVVESVYQNSKELLKIARISKQKSTRSLVGNYVDQTYTAAKKIINDERIQGKKELALHKAIAEMVESFKKTDKFDEANSRGLIETFLQSKFELIDEKDIHRQFAKDFYKKGFDSLDENIQKTELTYQRKKELLELLKQALKDEGLTSYGILKKSIENEVYKIGKSIIDAERKAGVTGASDTTANTGKVGLSGMFSFLNSNK